jgi:hypothetical protein
MVKFYDKLVNSAYLFDFPIHKPYFELTKVQKELPLERQFPLYWNSMTFLNESKKRITKSRTAYSFLAIEEKLRAPNAKEHVLKKRPTT